MTPSTRRTVLISSLSAAAAGCAQTAAPKADASLSPAALTEQVRQAEKGFAATMAKRDVTAFASFIAEDAVFINGGSPLRGKAAIMAFWSRFFTAPAAPFAWDPTIAELSGNGQLGYTEGPVTAPDGKVIMRFYSTWARQADGRWLVVFDNGYAPCKA